MKYLDSFLRVLGGIANVLNRKKKRDYANDAASAIANGDRVQQSSKSFDELANKSQRDSAK